MQFQWSKWIHFTIEGTGPHIRRNIGVSIPSVTSMFVSRLACTACTHKCSRHRPRGQRWRRSGGGATWCEERLGQTQWWHATARCIVTPKYKNDQKWYIITIVVGCSRIVLFYFLGVTIKYSDIWEMLISTWRKGSNATHTNTHKHTHIEQLEYCQVSSVSRFLSQVTSSRLRHIP